MAMDARSIIGFGRKFHSKFSHFNRWNFKTRFLDTVGKNQGSSPKLPREGLLQRESAGGREEVERRRKVVLFYLICVTLSRYSRFTVSTDSPDHYCVTLIAHSSPTNRQGKLVKNSSQDTSRTSSKKKKKNCLSIDIENIPKGCETKGYKEGGGEKKHPSRETFLFRGSLSSHASLPLPS